MTKRATAKYKIDRRLGVNLWGRAKSPLNSRNYGPGQHGQQRSKLSDYGIQLRAKQMLKKYYGEITERQFHRFYQEAVRCKGDTSENLIGLLERRLDAVLYRLKLVPTIFASRQMINHGHVTINGKRVDIPSCLVEVGDEVALVASIADHANVLAALASSERDVPEYLELDDRKKSGKFLRVPQLSDVPYPVQMQPNLVIEFYSR